MQQGANKAIAPAMTAASTEPPKKMLLFITHCNFHERGAALSARRPMPGGECALPLRSTSRPDLPLGHRPYFLVPGQARFPCALSLGDLFGESFLFCLNTQQAVM